jgi:hypothetical protein
MFVSRETNLIERMFMKLNSLVSTKPIALDPPVAAKQPISKGLVNLTHTHI